MSYCLTVTLRDCLIFRVSYCLVFTVSYCLIGTESYCLIVSDLLPNFYSALLPHFYSEGGLRAAGTGLLVLCRVCGGPGRNDWPGTQFGTELLQEGDCAS